MPRFTLALAMIARDEAPRIGRLLASVAPWVDHMLVLDTGSQDDTAAIARAHGTVEAGSVRRRGSWLAAHNLAVVHEGLGQAAEAAALRARHPCPAQPPR